MRWCTKLDKYQECYQITIIITLNMSSVGSLFGSDPGANVDEVGMKYWDSLFLKWKSKACYYYSLLNTMEKKCRRTSLPPPGPLSSSSSLDLLLQMLAGQHLEGCSSSVSWRTWVRTLKMITKWSKRGLLSLYSSSSSSSPRALSPICITGVWHTKYNFKKLFYSEEKKNHFQPWCHWRWWWRR